jgi:hypothetical protein
LTRPACTSSFACAPDGTRFSNSGTDRARWWCRPWRLNST